MEEPGLRLCLSVAEEAQAEFFGCLLLVFVSGFRLGCLGGSMASAPAQIQRLPSPVHSSTAGREELAVITGSQR